MIHDTANETRSTMVCIIIRLASLLPTRFRSLNDQDGIVGQITILFNALLNLFDKNDLNH